ncbi:MAG: hypothetical protein KBA91_02975 [Candidatus Moranbacteria bacterium]|nr:hypothetical protein [Candidatus Moranbacteria bacterium]
MKLLLFFQDVLIGASLLLLGAIPVAVEVFRMGFEWRSTLYALSFAAVFAVMSVRPLADITGWLWIRRLVILRKGFGIFSASIIIGFMIDALIAPQSTYFVTLFSMKFFSIDHYAVFAHLGDISGLILLLTSNAFSQRILKQNWKRIQRLSYVYFYAGGIYESFALQSSFALYAILLVTNLTVLAWAVKIWRKNDSRAVPGRIASYSR